MPSPQDSQPPASSKPKPRLTRVPSAGAVRLRVTANDPALPDIIGGSIAAEPHGEDWTLLITGDHGTKLLHIRADEPFHTVMAGVRAALALVSIPQAAYPEPAPSESEVAPRVSRGYGS